MRYSENDNLKSVENERKDTDRDFVKEYSDMISINNNVKPVNSTLRIIIIYLIVGVLWILFSDRILDMIVSDDETYRQIQLFKGWFYVVITAVIFSVIIYRTFRLYKEALVNVLHGYDDLNATYEDVWALNQELDEQNNELENQKSALVVSEQRYQIVTEGSYDGIWDWDIINDVYYMSDKWREELGYTQEELGKSIYGIEKLFFPGEWEKVRKKLDEYLENGVGVYDATYRLRKKSGESRWILSRGKGVWDKDGRAIRIAGSHTDITERKNMEVRLEKLAYYDTLTNLPNRYLFEQKGTELASNGRRYSIICFDIDNLKHINDLYGTGVGDRYLKYISELFCDVMGKDDIAARLSGDLFAVIHLIDEYDDTIRKLEFLMNQVRLPWVYEGEQIFVTISAGCSYFPENGGNFATVLNKAEIAMFKQKEISKDGYTLFEDSMYEETLKISQMYGSLKLALENEEFVLHYQPQIDLKTGKVLGVESLIRWNSPKNGSVPPMEFIPFSEKTGHIVPITLWVLKTAIIQCRKWQQEGFDRFKVAVNMSGYVILDPKAMKEVFAMLDEFRIRPGELEMEVTETALMKDLEVAREVLYKLREYGISIALDDFGTGYSSLTYLHTLPFDIMKMDREFIKNIETANEDNYIYKTLIDLAHRMDIDIIAEGIETEEQREFLMINECDQGQGYYFSKPLPAEKISEKLTDMSKGLFQED